MQGLAAAKWTEVLTAAIACVAPAVGWLTFCMTHGEKLDKSREDRREELELLRGAVEAIRPWAQTVYTDQNHDPAWYNASWIVFPLPLDAEHFRQLTASGELPEGLNAVVVRLEAAIRRFHEMLADQTEFRSRAPDDIALRYWAVIAASMWKSGPLDDDELPPDRDHRWLMQLYQRNKAIHVEGIGGPGGNGLHEALRLAAAELDPARERLGRAAREPGWLPWGHRLAAAFVFAGVILLAAFYVSFASKVAHGLLAQLCPCASVSSQPVPPMPSTAPAAPLPADSNATKRPQPTSGG